MIFSSGSAMHSSRVCQKCHRELYCKQRIARSHSKYSGRTYISCSRFPNGHREFCWLDDQDRDYNLEAEICELLDQLHKVHQELLANIEMRELNEKCDRKWSWFSGFLMSAMLGITFSMFLMNFGGVLKV